MDEKSYFLNEFKNEANAVIKWSLTLKMFSTNKEAADKKVNAHKKEMGINAYFLSNDMYARNQQLVHMSKMAMLARVLHHKFGVILAEKETWTSEVRILAFCMEYVAV